MGYDVEYEGEFRFAKPLAIPQLIEMSSMMGEDPRDFPAWGAPDGLAFIALEISKDFGGLEWDGSEKCSEMEEVVNFVLRRMRSKWPDFEMDGEMEALGEDGKRWIVRIGGSGLAEVV